jgi:inner membrane protein
VEERPTPRRGSEDVDNVSHSLAGWALSRAAGPRRPPGTTLALVLASNLPDIDIVLQARSDAAYLLFHRGLTHSLIGLVVLPLALAAGLWWGYGGRARFRWLALVCGAGVALHLLYDLTTSWGTMLLYPFSVRRYALDWLFIVDLVTWAVPVAVLVWSRVRPERARAAVAAGMLALFAYGGSAALVHRDAVAAVASAERAAGRAAAEAAVFPRIAAPFRWHGVVVAPPGTAEPRIRTYEVRGIPPVPALAGRIDRSFDDPWVAAALASRSGQAYLWWARVPVAIAAREGDEVTVTLRDLRYSRTLVPTAESRAPFDLRFRFDARTRTLIEVRW